MMNTMKKSEANALIRLNKSEIEYVIIALVLAKQSSEHFSNFDYSKMFKKLSDDFIKIKNQLGEEVTNEEETYRTGESISCETCE